MPLHTGIYEVHLPTTDLDRAIAFYERVLGFQVGLRQADASSALLLYEHRGDRSMLGLFEVDEIGHRHPAEHHASFRVPAQAADEMVGFLEDRGVQPVHPPTAPREGPMDEPIVHGWMPAAAVFFRDPDGNLLELIAELPQDPRPDVVYQPLSAWRARVSDGA